MKTLQINQQVDDEVYTKIQELLNKKDGMWKPKLNETYYYLDYCGDVSRDTNENTDSDKETFSIGNFYRTEEEAKSKLEWLKAVQRIKEYIAREFKPVDDDEAKAIFIFNGKRFLVECYYSKHYSPFGDVRGSDAEQLIKNCEADLKIIFNVK